MYSKIIYFVIFVLQFFTDAFLNYYLGGGKEINYV